MKKLSCYDPWILSFTWKCYYVWVFRSFRIQREWEPADSEYATSMNNRSNLPVGWQKNLLMCWEPRGAWSRWEGASWKSWTFREGRMAPFRGQERPLRDRAACSQLGGGKEVNGARLEFRGCCKAWVERWRGKYEDPGRSQRGRDATAQNLRDRLMVTKHCLLGLQGTWKNCFFRISMAIETLLVAFDFTSCTGFNFEQSTNITI